VNSANLFCLDTAFLIYILALCYLYNEIAFDSLLSSGVLFVVSI
jgi:hypothetical protein